MNKQIEINGKKIVYRVYGNGKPVMLVHEPPLNFVRNLRVARLPPKEGLRNAQSQLSEDADRIENFRFSEHHK